MKPPANTRTPAFFQVMQWLKDPFAYMDEYSKRYGDAFSVPFGKKYSPMIFMSNPQAIQEIFTREGKDFDTPPGGVNRRFQPLIGSRGLLLLSGTSHRRHRQLVMPPFHGERMQTYGQAICDIADQQMDKWKENEPFSMRPTMQAISLQVILRTVFGLAKGKRSTQVETLLTEMLDGIMSPAGSRLLYYPMLQRNFGPLSPWSKFLRRRGQIDELIYAEIRDRKAQPDHSGTDILNLLMAARDEAGQPMADEELRDELMTLLVAGHETTASALTWALYWIHQQPSVREALLSELDGLGDDPDPNAIFRLPYLTAVCSETLRINPVGFLTFSRVARSACELGGYQLEAGAEVIGCIYLAHQREDVYPDPRRFRPERFLERQFSPYEYLPFGGGSRRCVGMAFALFEMKLVLARVLTRMQLTALEGPPARPVRRGLTASPSEVQLIATQRRRRAVPVAVREG